MTRGSGFLGAVIVLGAALLGLTVLPSGGGSRLSQAGVPLEAYANFEGAQTSPVRIGPSGRRLFAVNTADARLSVFDLADPSAPRLDAEIPVGMEPVSVNPRTDDEAWVVNQVSDSISVVSVSRGIVVDTIQVKDEPADVVFIGDRAFVTASRSNALSVIDVNSRTEVTRVQFFAENPRALAASPDGQKLYVAFALQGNHTTVIPAGVAPAPPPPTNPDLPSAPPQGVIVDADDPAWEGAVHLIAPENNVAEVDVATLSITRYFSGVGSTILGLAVRPTTGDVFVANTNARNLTRFEPNLRGHFVDNRVTRITVADGSVLPVDLNPDVDYGVLPNPTAQATALAQPTALLFEPDGGSLYVAAFGTDRVARVDVEGMVTDRIDVGPPTARGAAADPENKRGPRGLALHPHSPYLYVLNRISNTITVVDTATSPPRVVTETAVGGFDPTPAVIRRGRGFLYDAKLSGNGTAACAACHVDADMDFLAWDLGDPGGTMQTVGDFEMHPMKGPLMTQTLRGLAGLEPYHWRGDRADFEAFNPAFRTVMGSVELSSPDMAAYRAFVDTLRFPPNPNQNLDRTLPDSVFMANPIAGRETFFNEQFRAGRTCNECHALSPGPGTNATIFAPEILAKPQPFKVPQLRNLYQRANLYHGFAFGPDGSFATVSQFLSQPEFGSLADDMPKIRDLQAFLMAIDTGTAPAVGYTRTIGPGNAADPAVARDWTLLEDQAAAGNVDLIAKGTVDGQLRGLLYRPSSGDYWLDQTGRSPLTRSQLTAKLAAGDTLSFMGVAPGSGVRMGIDRDLDGRLDDD